MTKRYAPSSTAQTLPDAALARVGAVAVVLGEAQPAVHLACGRVRLVDVEHRDGEAPGAQVVEAGHGERRAEPPSGRRRIDTDDVDLAHRRRRAGVHLGPAEALEVPGPRSGRVGVEQEEPFGVE